MLIYVKDPDAMPEIRCIVFDVDGVLVDVRKSFNQMIALATDYYFRLKFGLKGRKKLVSKKVIDVFKKIGGFNNDWDLTSAIVYLYLNFYFMKGMPSSVEELRVDEKNLIKAVLEIDGFSHQKGYEAFLAKARYYFGTTLPENFFDRELVEGICKLLYAGNKADEVYGNISLEEKQFEKRLKSFNLYSRECVLLDERFLPDGISYGLVTGRTPGELGLLRSSFPILFREAKHVVYDDGTMPKKPQPQVMERFIKEGLLPLIFVGDSRDDFETVVNVRKYYQIYDIFFAAVIDSFESFDFFLRLDSDFICSDVNLLLLTVGGNEGNRSIQENKGN